MSSFTTIIYDMDGTLIDSERHWQEANKIFYSKHGLEFTQELNRYLMGRSSFESLTHREPGKT